MAARISILFGLRGEALTCGGGNVAGALAFGVAVRALRDGHAAMALAGGATCLEPEYLEAASLLDSSKAAAPGCGACLLLLGRPGAGGAAADGQVLGYGEGFGPNAVRDAVQASLEDAAIGPSRVGAVRAAGVSDWSSLARALRAVGVGADLARSPSSGLCAASFPLAVAEATVPSADGISAPFLVVGSDCLAGAVAAMVRGGP